MLGRAKNWNDYNSMGIKLSGGDSQYYSLETFGYLSKKWTYPKGSGIFRVLLFDLCANGYQLSNVRWAPRRPST